MALTSREDLLGPSISQPERQVYELMKERVHDANAPMPPPSSRKLTAAELATLDSQLAAELAVGPVQCAGSAARRADFPPPDPSEIEQCYPFHAYASSGELDKPFRVANGETYGCFAFEIPWQANAQAVSVRVRTSPIVHHWRLLDQQLGLPQGTVLVAPTDCSFGTTTTYANVDVTDVKEINMPPTVGLQLPAPESGLKMMLNVHYFNTGAAVDDTSGAEVCVARKPREHTAGVHIVQANSFSLPPRQATKVTTVCTPKYAGDIHIIQSLPHMHTRGTRLQTIVQRANGTTETLIDVPFDFNNQILYQTDMVLKSGDKLLTTCHYQNDTDRTIYPGVSTEDEMCLNDITAWPAGSLYSGVTPDGTKGCYE
jgi:hypothetical protein